MILILAQEGDSPAKSDAKIGDAKKTDGDPKDAKKAEGEAEQKTEGEEKATEQEAIEEQPSGPSWYNSGALGLMIDGGFFMWPILLLGILAAGVIIERFRSLKMLKTDTASLRNNVLAHLTADEPREALNLCELERGPVPAILSSGLRRYVVLKELDYDAGRIENQVIKTMEDYGVHVVAALERHLPVLATIASVAPMLGFLGTVQGMIVAFDDIVATMGEKNIVEAAAMGIKVALLTTCFGLIIGIPAFMAFNYFTSVINRFVLDVEESATELIEAVTLKMTLEGGEATLPSKTAGV